MYVIALGSIHSVGKLNTLFTSRLPDLFVLIPTRLPCEAFSHAAISTRRLFIHMCETFSHAAITAFTLFTQLREAFRKHLLGNNAFCGVLPRPDTLLLEHCEMLMLLIELRQHGVLFMISDHGDDL